MADALALIKRYVHRLESAHEAERRRKSESFAREAFIHAPSHLQEILPPEFFIETSYGLRFNTKYVDVEPKGPHVARLLIKGVNGAELLIYKTPYATYGLCARIKCPTCGEPFTKEIRTPRELLTILEGKAEVSCPVCHFKKASEVIA